MAASHANNSRGSDVPRGAATSAASPGLFAAALLLPPLAIFRLGGVSRDFWIALALTCLGYLPGVAFAFVRLFGRTRRKAPA
jgi:uncharacterized membrane protein YqaE (UPF0057 family)